MAISSWMLRNRSMRSKGRPPEDCYKLNAAKSDAENAFDIYQALSFRATSEHKRLNLLNALVKLLQQVREPQSLGFSVEDFLYCISPSLVHPFTQVRAAALRAVRHLMSSPKDVQSFNDLQLSHLVCRSLDIVLKNEEERVQALKLIRRMLSLASHLISPVIVRCLVSLVESGSEDGDRMLRSCLAVLCEFGVLNPVLLIVCGGVSAITRNLLECHSPRIAESLCGVLLHLLEWPHTRNIAGVRLECLAAPYCDFTYRLGIMDKNKDARDLRFTCSRLALLSVLRSWAGTIEFCDPSKPSGLKAIVDVLYLNQLEVRKSILDLLYELLELPQPVWTDEYSVALSVVDPADFQDSWRLSEGFVAMEGRSVLPTLASRVPNPCEIHLALLLYCFLEAGLLDALGEVIVSSDTFISVRATVLLGRLLHLMHTLLPADICNTSPSLPTLITHAAQGNHQATAAVAALQDLHQIMKNRPASCSLFLDSIIQSGSIVHTKLFKREISGMSDNPTLLLTSRFSGTLERKRHDSVGSSSTSGAGDLGGEGSVNGSGSSKLGTIKKSGSFKRSKLLHLFDSGKEVSDRLLKESNVLLNKDGNVWDWDIIVAILKSDSLLKMDDNQCRFVRRLVHYFKPSNNRFSHQDLGHGRHVPATVLAGVELVDWLLRCQDGGTQFKVHKYTYSLESLRHLTDLFADINSHLQAISTSRSAHDCLFSPQHMVSTMCQQYFLLIGRMCRSDHGINILKNTDIFNQLRHLVTTTNHVCYNKLIVSGLDYSRSPMPRQILEKALTEAVNRSGRLYATQFLLVLMRAKIPNFEMWGLSMLVNQTKDTEQSVVNAALEILEEACHEPLYLNELVSMWPPLASLGDAGKLVKVRFYSTIKGLNHINANIVEQTKYWANSYNKRYVLLLEADIHSSLTLHTKNEDGTYSRRCCSTRPTTIPPNVLPHLYGQLVQTSAGMVILQKHGNLPKLIEILSQGVCTDEMESLTLKSAIWALGHVSTSAEGVEYLNDPISRVYEKIIFLAKHCEVYSVRATALNVLGLIGSTSAGANILFKLDWMCVRHNRNTIWPVCEPEDWFSKHLTPIRHQIGDMPPYNYRGIEENVVDFGTTAETSFYFDEANESKLKFDEFYDTSIHISEATDEGVTPKSKSRTLPESLATRANAKHMRSLSESKTSDGLSLITVTNRTRFNSGTDSNTSGVSSCDSIVGKNIIGDLQQTLSPIPSTSNLLDIRKPSEKRLRKISLTGVPIRENTISPQDLEGYAKLRSLRRHQRPMLSESAADELAEMMDDVILRTNKLELSDQQRSLKVRSLDRQGFSLTPSSSFKNDDLSSPKSVSSSLKLMSSNDCKGPCYSGICLPRNILDLFPKRNTSTTYVSRCTQDVEVGEMNNLLVLKQQFLVDGIGEGDESSVSSLSDISTNSKRSKWAGKHNRSNCLHCCRSKINRLHPRTDSDINIRRKSQHNSLLQLSDISFHSPESVLSEESMPDRITASILRYVQRMANPLWSKQSKISLLELKQKHPYSFQDICLYSEICKSMGRNTYRQNARRFLQELFLDLDYDSFYSEANEIVQRREREDGDSAKGIRLELEIVEPDRPGVDEVDAADVANTSAAQNWPVAFQKSTKLGLKSPPLASVYETSVENLLDNGKSTKVVKVDCHEPPESQKRGDWAMRPRFNTLELDLTCTHNKFPITDRNRKKDYSPTWYVGIFEDGLKDLSSAAFSTGSLYCEKRLQTYKSEASLPRPRREEKK
ncbi:rapamycin-insensitive companion of mTOR [Phlebotomus argentipes]|uniref:rapamycin-insensitive companion of mTOR n=1 Tax=Phlebotomus argentipes TaxID=94469 RepID=UPI002893168B|nr:rapamycin-insensitive companion of mTOR [Phlebotomus argentipes]